MHSTTWQRVRKLFEAAVALPLTERTAYLDQACDDAAIRAEVESLLLADDRAAAAPLVLNALAPNLVDAFDDAQLAAKRDRWTGARLGAWRLLKEIGRGGMGAVYLAERADDAYQQQVAIKLVHPGWETGDLLQRFAAERQILAALNHPGIARLIDGGSSADGTPYLVLEYVDGTHLGHYCDQHRLSIQQRLRTFLDVCAVVAFAHRCLVVHRDLKPSNILVDTTGQVKLLDFGIAKLLAGHAAVSAVRAFTPEYAAPEQVRGEPVTTGVDVYALGLLLYELLTGRHAYGETASTPAAYEQAILTQEPERPSHAAARTDPDAARRAQARVLAPEALSAHLRGDLDAIVLKALRKEPAQRYASVEDLAADVERHLRRMPVLARRGNWRYVAGRFLRRHALASALAASALISLIGGLGVALWQADEARQQRDAAARAAQTSAAVAGFMSRIFANADPAANEGRDPPASELLAAGVREIELATDLPDSERSALYYALGSAQLAREAPGQGLELMRRAVDLSGTDPVARFNALNGLASAYNQVGELDESETAHELARAWLAQQPHLPARYRDDLDYLQGVNRISLGRRVDAEAMLAELRARLLARGEGLSDRGIAAASMLVYLLGARKQDEAALALSTEAYLSMRADASASLIRRKAVVAPHAYAVMKSGRLDEAEALFRETLALDEQIFGEGHLRTLVSLNNVGHILGQQKRYEEAAGVLERVRAIRREKLAPGSTRLAFSTLRLAQAYFRAGHQERALVEFDEGLRIYREAGQSEHIDALRGSYQRAQTLHALGRYRDALDSLSPVLDTLLASANYRAADGNPIRLLDAELHQRLAIDDRACRVRAELTEPSDEDLAKLAALEVGCVQ